MCIELLMFPTVIDFAMGVQAPECAVDVFAWKHILPSGIPVIEDR